MDVVAAGVHGFHGFISFQGAAGDEGDTGQLAKSISLAEMTLGSSWDKLEGAHSSGEGHRSSRARSAIRR